ncbi:MAG TPA: FHA domain-containing protein [Marmoricola sp.]|nr:FHA domain-containing protein [Marmoricola sp.]
MSTLTLLLIRYGYLALLWVFILATVLVIRSDMFGTKVARQPARGSKAAKPAPKSKPSKPRRGEPTHVHIVDGSGAGRSVSLSASPLLIGRGPDAAIRLDDDYASTRHARIVRSGDQWFVEDLGSTNGTYLGSRRLTQPTVISVGSQIRIGKTVLELRK